MENYKEILHCKEEQTIDTLQLENSELKKRLSLKEQQLLSLTNANKAYANEMMHYIAMAEKANLDKEMIQNSEFWKLTKPIRRLVDIIKGEKKDKDSEKFSHEKIKTFMKIANYFELGNRKIIKKDQLISYERKKKRKILLVTHEMLLTGAPIALFYFAKMLKEGGECPVIISPCGGKLEEECTRYGIPALIDPMLYRENTYKSYINLFDIVIANTIASAPIINGLSESQIPVLWWIHEAETSYQDENFFGAMPQHIPDNVRIYAVGDYAKKRLLYHKPLYTADDLLYYVPKNESGEEIKFELPIESKDKVVFSLVGVQEYRKGFDVFIDAIRKLDDGERKKCYFVFVGKKHYKPIYNKIQKICKDFPENTFFLEELDRKEMGDLYKEIDCYVCASRDDPMPIVATEAMQNNVPVIVSENTGTAKIVETEKCGLIYKNNSAEELSEKILYLINNKNKREVFGNNGYKAYMKYFSQEAFYCNAKKALEDTEENVKKENIENQYNCLKKISIVIPTYNAGNQFDIMLFKLKNQKFVKSIEIIVVDSGSKDDTLKIAEKYQAHIYKIKHEEFSHSFARNMGAKKASGEIIIFMTQDALPIGDNWISKIVKPIDECKVAAVSVAELCPDSTELFYKIATKSHAEFCGITDGNRYNQLTKNDDALELRKKASLTDITCAIHAKIFREYGYRFNYAEDLDMGIRLLRDGYRIAILSDVRVLHGHNRSCGYYVKRALVEQLSFDSILPQCASYPDEVHKVALRIISASGVVKKTLDAVKKELLSEEKTISEYLDKIIEKFERYLNNPELFDGTVYLQYTDKIVNNCIEKCQKFCRADYIGDYLILNELNWYINNDLKRYFEINEYTKCSNKKIKMILAESINDCIEKQMSVHIGVELSKLRYNICLYDEFGDLLTGV